MDTPPTDFDGAWKAALERHFEAFLDLCFPDVHNDIDWSQPPRFLETELQQVAPHENAGKQRVDKLVEVALSAGGDAWILVHIEIQNRAPCKVPTVALPVGSQDPIFSWA